MPDASRVVTCSDDLSLRVWDVPGDTEGPAGGTCTGHDAPINAVIALEDGRVASGGCDCRVIIWDLEGQQEAVRPHASHGCHGRRRCLSGPGSSWDGGGWGEGHLGWTEMDELEGPGRSSSVLLALATQVLEGQGMDNWVMSLVSLPGRDELAAGSYKDILIWSISRAVLLRKLEGHKVGSCLRPLAGTRRRTEAPQGLKPLTPLSGDGQLPVCPPRWLPRQRVFR